MRENFIKELFALVFGGILGVVFKYWYDYRIVVLKALWDKRFESYQKMFTLTSFLPLYPKRAEVTYGDILDESAKMRDWYFENGGLVLSKKARDQYFEAQRKIQAILKREQDGRLRVKNEDYEEIRRSFSLFRTEMTSDLMSRSRLHGLFERKNTEPKQE